MIVPMSKYTFIIHHSDQQAFISAMMDLGVVHVHSSDQPIGDAYEGIQVKIKIIEKVIREFEGRLKKLKNTKPDIKASNLPDNETLTQLLKEKNNLNHQVSTLQDEIQVMEPWGEFDWRKIKALENTAELNIRFYQYPRRSFKKRWIDEYNIEIINRDDQNIYFLAMALHEAPEFPVVPINLPDLTLQELEAKLTAVRSKLEALNRQLDQYALTGMDELQTRLLKAKDELSFMTAEHQLSEDGHGHLFTVTGWCPQTQKEALTAYLDKQNVVYIEHADIIKKEAPVLLKNNWFNRLFEPIGKLFSLPSYNEMDLTLFFAPFFFLFFGFCLGDAGYGLILLITGTIAKFFYTKQKDVLSLLQLFGISTAIIGFFSGTFFGLELVELEEMKAFRSYFLSRDQLFNVALIIGFVQILFGLGLNAYKRWVFNSWQAAMSRIGWMFLLLALVDVYILEWIIPYSRYVIWGALVLIVFFGAPDKGWIKSIGLGLVDLYNITGMLGDILSYIRLFALGVSSAILGLVINSIALEAMAIPYAGVIVFVVILVVGHGANLALAGLSAFVHPMRLTFVEFYKNAGFEGGGKPYNPLKRLLNNKS